MCHTVNMFIYLLHLLYYYYIDVVVGKKNRNFL